MLATTIHKSNTTPHHQVRRQHTTTRHCLRTQQRAGRQVFHVVARTQPAPTTGVGLHTAHTPPTGVFFVVLLRKEVIQPHLPVRLPCYDFVPIADPTFDSSPHKG